MTATKIFITSGTGEGATALSAFHRALRSAGIHNLNLVLYSSVVPSGTEIIEAAGKPFTRHFGAQGNVVLAKSVALKLGEKAVAGIGWVMDEGGKGYFVEQKGHSFDEVETEIKKSLDDMLLEEKDVSGGLRFGSRIEEISCKGKPAAAVAAAIYSVTPIG
ncbi:MAG: pyruvoyl-dependent arginine decarboxylase [Candidatus Aenigmarchaeota archaeon]|nr:pyruvoyl-dependent arginine decarboxylase [Candidatus Aenigmarchaeota archaeon]